MIKRSPENWIRKAASVLGYTKDPFDAGYIAPDGRLLKLGQTECHHTKIHTIGFGDCSDGHKEFCRVSGAARFRMNPINGSILFDCVGPATEKQIARLNMLMCRCDSTAVVIDMGEHHVRFGPGTRTSDLLNWFKERSQPCLV